MRSKPLRSSARKRRVTAFWSRNLIGSLFYAFWQRSRFIWGEAEKLKNQPDALKGLWDQEIKGSAATAPTPATPTAAATAGTPAIEGYYKQLELIKGEFYGKLREYVLNAT